MPPSCACILEAQKPVLEDFIDADMVDDLDHGLSTFGYLFTFVRGAISMQSRL